ncbi:hypothetical protein M569_10147 [Genlisea aurea]|uniref:Uncharacterized protein n=1 Tax=Genlisea aurea TaxID=192259 RepID=S8CCE4_9LAMI|nr:hypothetical protein M569_10147 [Genlisea aurea]
MESNLIGSKSGYSRNMHCEREAVSTSHCAQSNTIEYEMAMSWCLLQSKYDKCLEELWKQQRSELEKLTIKVK